MCKWIIKVSCFTIVVCMFYGSLLAEEVTNQTAGALVTSDSTYQVPLEKTTDNLSKLESAIDGDAKKSEAMERSVILDPAILESINQLALEGKTTSSADGKIILDGDFSDWEDIETMVSNERSTPGMTRELKTLKAYISDNHLYLYVERWETNESDYYWDLDIAFFDNTNTNKGQQFQRPPWTTSRLRVPTVDAFIYKDDITDNYIVEVAFSSYFTSTYSVSQDFLKAEFEIPLELLGINSQTTDIVFGVSSVSSQGLQEDWIPRNGPLVITGGSVFGFAEPYIIAFTILITIYIV